MCGWDGIFLRFVDKAEVSIFKIPIFIKTREILSIWHSMGEMSDTFCFKISIS